MRLLHILLSALLVLSPAAYGEAEPSAQEVVTAVEATYRDVQSLSANFVQVTRSSMGETRQQGAVQLKRPRMMRWDFTQPSASSFITNGQQLWVWSADQNQVIVTDDLSGATSGNDMSQLLGDLSKLSELFNVQEIAQSAGSPSYTLQLTPKKDASFKQLQIVVARDSYTLQRVVVVDSFDSVVELDFTGVTMNPEIPDARFNFTVPAGATIIKTDGI